MSNPDLVSERAPLRVAEPVPAPAGLGRFLPSDLLGWLLVPAMVVSLYAAFLFAPTEKTMGDVQRIFYFHMPSAWVALLSFGVVFVASIQWLRTKQTRWDNLAVAATEVGVVFTSLALVTGSIWAKSAWGTWWDWDPRLTTTLILWLIYVSNMMLRSAVDNPSRRASLAAVVGIVGFVDVPIVFMSIRLWRTIHPVVITASGMEMDSLMAATLMVCLATFTLLFVHLLRLRYTLERQREEVLRMRETVLYED